MLLLQGANISQLERDIGSDQFPPNEHYFGLVNVSRNKYNDQTLFPMYLLLSINYKLFLSFFLVW